MSHTGRVPTSQKKADSLCRGHLVAFCRLPSCGYTCSVYTCVRYCTQLRLSCRTICNSSVMPFAVVFAQHSQPPSCGFFDVTLLSSIENLVSLNCMKSKMLPQMILPRFWQLKGSRMGQSDKVSLWCVALLINTRFRFFILE